MISVPCFLALESGDLFQGQSFGTQGEAYGELVFNTGMTGYQEIITDPSYKNQIITFSYPEIGNYGIHPQDNESNQIHCSGIVVKHYNHQYSHSKAISSLSDFLIKNKILAIEGIDTRKLIKIIRNKGCQKAILTTHEEKKNDLIKKVKKSPSMINLNLTKKVATKKIYEWKDKAFKKNNIKYTIGVIDYGLKTNILRLLSKRNCKIIVLPPDTSLNKIKSYSLDGLLLSNGPGDPSVVTDSIKTIKQLIGKIPIFGICFGHQVIGQALNFKTYKLKFGHRGCNQPVKDKTSKQIKITSQNHGFAIDEKKKSKKIFNHIHLNDFTISGIDLPNKYLHSVQYHPEASPGPHDGEPFFDYFLSTIDYFKNNA